MKTIEIFAEAVKFASEASDIPSDRILSESRDADVVDARMLVIQTLYGLNCFSVLRTNIMEDYGNRCKIHTTEEDGVQDRHEDRVSEMRKELERFVRCFHLGREVSQASPQAPS